MDGTSVGTHGSICACTPGLSGAQPVDWYGVDKPVVVACLLSGLPLTSMNKPSRTWQIRMPSPSAIYRPWLILVDGAGGTYDCWKQIPARRDGGHKQPVAQIHSRADSKEVPSNNQRWTMEPTLSLKTRQLLWSHRIRPYRYPKGHPLPPRV